MALPELKVKIGTDTGELDKGLGNAQASVAKFAAAAAAAFAATGAAVVALTKKGLDFVDAQAKLARSMDATANGLRAVQFAGSDAGVSVEGVNTSLQMMARRLVEARTEGTPAANALKAIGLNAAELSRMDADERLATIADRAKEMGLSAGEASRVLQDLGVRSREMALLVIQGGDAIRAARGELEQLGLAFTPQQAATIERANDAMMRVQTVGEAISTQFAVQLAPVLEVVANRLVTLAKESGGFQEAIATAFDVAVKAAGFFLDAIQVVRIGLATLTEAAAVAGHIWARLFDTENLDAATRTLSDARARLNSLLEAPPPSRAFEKEIEAIRDAAIEAGTAVGEILGGNDDFIIPGLGGAGTVSDKMAQRLEALITSLQTEHEVLAEWYAAGQELINNATEAELEALGGKHEAIERLNAEHQSRLAAMEEKAAAERARIQQKEAADRQKGWGNFWNNMTSLMNSGSRAMFNIGKVAALAKGVIDMYEAVMGAYKVGARIGGPPLGAAFAAAAGAAQAANLAAIRSAQFGGGGSAAQPAAGGGTVASQALTGTGADAETRRDQTIFVRGLNPGDLVRGSDLIEAINEAIDNGARIKVVAT